MFYFFVGRGFLTWALLTDPLPGSGRPIVARVRLCGNVFTESLPSNRSIRHNRIGILKSSVFWDITYIFC
jgi:hypothetical protein